MNGHLSEDRLHDYVDRLLPARERRRVEDHLAACDECRREAEAVRSLLRELAELPAAIAPARDLRPGIAARLPEAAAAAGGTGEAAGEEGEAPRAARRTDAPRGPAEIPFRDVLAARRRSLRSLRYPLAAAALLLIAFTALVTSAVVGKKGAPSGERTAVAGPPDGVLLAGYRETEREYAAAIAELQDALDRQRELLSPQTVRLLEESLRVVDLAIAQARAALSADPGNAAIREMAVAAYRQKVDLLRRAAALGIQG